MSVLRLYNGGLLDILNPDPDSFTLSDICTSLSRIPRFGGHSRFRHVVLNHSLNCVREAEIRGLQEDVIRLIWVHDFSEGLKGFDAPTPFKKLCPELIRIENILQKVIYDKYNIVHDAEAYAEMKQIDELLTYHEAMALVPTSRTDPRWTKPVLGNIDIETYLGISVKRSTQKLVEEFWRTCAKYEISD